MVLGLSLTIRSALLAMLVASGLRGVPYDTSNLLPMPSCDAGVPLMAGERTSRTSTDGLHVVAHILARQATSTCDVRAVQCAGRHADADALSRLAVWDSAFFVRIAQCGYEYEQFHAFFPLLPLLLRLTSFGGA